MCRCSQAPPLPPPAPAHSSRWVGPRRSKPFLRRFCLGATDRFAMLIPIISTVLFAGLIGGHAPPVKRIPSNSGFEVRPPGGSSRPLDVTLDERTNCTGGLPDGAQPPNRANTTLRVATLIDGMISRGYNAYVIPSSDAHQSEYVSAADERRAYISGFSGSAGTAVVLADGQRALWTDGRYFLQADDQLDCQWLLMKSGLDGVPTIAEWLSSELGSGDVVSADARLLGYGTWISFQEALAANGVSVVVDGVVDGNNLLDEQWNADGRPPYSLDPIFSLEFQFTGRDWNDKISDIEAEMEGYGADAYVITALDETAWTLNLRGSDIDFNPVFRSYIIIDRSGLGPSEVSLFVPDIAVKVPEEVNATLGVGDCVPTRPCVSLVNYDDIEDSLAALGANDGVSTIMMSGEFSTSEGASYFIYNLIPEEKRVVNPSPVLLMKAGKNEVERQGMKNAHVKDAVALISFLAFLENEITNGSYWTEVSAQELLATYRYEQPDNMGLSFGTISGFGPNGAIIHYEATADTDVQITDQNLYLVDSGGQYKDGTTDVTRTLHYGIPTIAQMEAYTRVLTGVIDFAAVVFPKGTYKTDIDILARRSLYSVGLDYRHGTSHGVGCFLNVHEGSDVVYELGFHGSDEPGYYEDGYWGIRIENVIAVVNVTTKYDFTEESYGLETLTLVPMEPKLIAINMLTQPQCERLNAFNANIREVMGPILVAQNREEAYDWMMSKTDPYTC